MKVDLICSNNLRDILTELLSTRGICLDEKSDIVIVESGHEHPMSKISVGFDVQIMSKLMEFLDKLSRIGEENISTIIGKNENKYEVISVKQVYYFEGRGNNTFCITENGEYRIKEKLYELEERLPNNRFIRVNRSFIVNIGSVKEIIPWFGRRLVLKFNRCNTEIEVSKNYTKTFKEFIGM